MNRPGSRSVGLPAAHNVGDLDGYTFGQDSSVNYVSVNNNDFGFDPPASNLPAKIEHAYSPDSTYMNMLASWSGFDQDGDNSQMRRNKSVSSRYSQSYDAMMASPPPDTASVVSRFGQITPPRSNSATSSVVPQKEFEESSAKVVLHGKKKCNIKTEIKTEPTEKSEATPNPRKRKVGRKSTVDSAQANNEEPVASPADSKRKMSLEKNRLAAAKCRINKKEKTDQLQRDSHDKAVQNTLLRQTILDMKTEVQELQTLLMAHSSRDGCSNPKSIHQALSSGAREHFADLMRASHYDDFVPMHREPQETTMRQLSQQSAPLISDGYFQSQAVPPLPDFDPGEFEIQTPM